MADALEWFVVFVAGALFFVICTLWVLLQAAFALAIVALPILLVIKLLGWL